MVYHALVLVQSMLVVIYLVLTMTSWLRVGGDRWEFLSHGPDAEEADHGVDKCLEAHLEGIAWEKFRSCVRVLLLVSEEMSCWSEGF